MQPSEAWQQGRFMREVLTTERGCCLMYLLVVLLDG